MVINNSVRNILFSVATMDSGWVSALHQPTDIRVTAVSVLDAPPEKVWDLLTDWDRQASWMRDIAWIRVVGSERHLRARLEVRTKVLGVPLVTDRLEVVVWNPPVRLVVRHVGLVKGRGEWQLDRRGNRTWFRWTEDLSLTVPLLGGLILRVYRPFLRSALRRSLGTLRREVQKRR